MIENFPQKVFLLPVAAISTLIIGLFLFAKFGPGIPISLVTTTKTDLFTVTGEGKVAAVPDIAQIDLGIQTHANTVAEAQAQANTIISSVTTAIKKLGVGDKDIQTVSYNLRPEYDFTSGRPCLAGASCGGGQSIKGYVADINLIVKARQFDKINQIIDAATANGANQIGGLTFTLDDATREKAESQARKQAIDQAKKKAAEIAAESGLTLGKIINVSENNPNVIRPMPMMAKTETPAGQSPLGGAQIQPGSSEITISVALSFETR